MGDGGRKVGKRGMSGLGMGVCEDLTCFTGFSFGRDWIGLSRFWDTEPFQKDRYEIAVPMDWYSSSSFALSVSTMSTFKSDEFEKSMVLARVSRILVSVIEWFVRTSRPCDPERV